MKPLSTELHNTVLLYVIYTALTRWIPLPLADQIVANVLRRQMIERFASAHALVLSKAAVKSLADEKIGCLYGCLFNILLFPIKLIVGKLFLLFRMTRFLNEASRAYHSARLCEFALRAGLVQPLGPHTPEAVRAAVDDVCRDADLGPVNAVFRHVLKKQTGVLRDIAAIFMRVFRRERAAGGAAERAIQSAEAEAQSKTDTLIGPLRTALEALPPEHFRKLEAQVETALQGTSL